MGSAPSRLRNESWKLKPMRRYYFDLRDGDELAVNEEGVELRDIDSVQEEAART